MSGTEGITILQVSIHGLIRGSDLELGRNADTGGQTSYVVDLTRELGDCDGVARCVLLTRLITDAEFSDDYALVAVDEGHAGVDALHAVEHAVWVWQGGPRQMDTDEVLGLLNAVGDSDPLPDFTEGMLLGLGTRSRWLLDNDPQAVSALPGFMNGLEQLTRLSAIRDGKAQMAPRKVADILEEGTRELVRALGRPTERHLASLIRYRDPSEVSQERRHYGGRPGGGGAPLRPEPFT